MNRFNLIALAFLGLAACDGGSSDTGGGSDTNKPGGLDASATWSGTGVVVSITNGDDTAGYDFGMAQTGSDDGWAGEDCLGEVPAGYDYMIDGGYQVCHHLNQTGGSLSTVGTPDEVVDGSTTLLQQGHEATITYVLFESSSSACWSWGDDVLYYDAYSCTIL